MLPSLKERNGGEAKTSVCELFCCEATAEFGAGGCRMIRWDFWLMSR